MNSEQLRDAIMARVDPSFLMPDVNADEPYLARLIHSLDAAVAVLATGAVIQRAIFVANSGRRLRR
jgi:hypothetical protein